MALKITTEEFCKLAGHDGSEIVLPGYPEPICRAGFHPQEAVRVAWLCDHSATPFEVRPMAINAHGTEPRAIKGHQNELADHFTYGRGVIECLTREHTGHAVAFEGGMIYDPQGNKYTGLHIMGLTATKLWRVEPRE